MPRAIDGTRRKDRRKKVLDQAKGYWGRRSKITRTAKDAVKKAGLYAYRDRKVKKREFRQLWIARISAAVREEGMSYSRFMNGLNKATQDLVDAPPRRLRYPSFLPSFCRVVTTQGNDGTHPVFDRPTVVDDYFYQC